MAKKIKLKSNKRSDSASVFSRVSELTEGITGLKVEIYSNRTAVVDGCKGVIEYYDSLIKLNIGCGTITFSGSNMHITSFDLGAAVITGRIESVEYCM